MIGRKPEEEKLIDKDINNGNYTWVTSKNYDWVSKDLYNCKDIEDIVNWATGKTAYIEDVMEHSWLTVQEKTKLIDWL